TRVPTGGAFSGAGGRHSTIGDPRWRWYVASSDCARSSSPTRSVCGCASRKIRKSIASISIPLTRCPLDQLERAPLAHALSDPELLFRELVIVDEELLEFTEKSFPQIRWTP